MADTAVRSDPIVEAWQEGASAALTGRSPRTNPYIARCSRNNQGRHRYFSPKSTTCDLCFAPRYDREREEKRRAWKLGFDETTAQIRKEHRS